MVKLVGKEVGTTGFGLMSLARLHDQPSIEQAMDTMKAALENGANFWNGGEFYGTPEYNSLHILNAYFKKYPEDADKVVISIKGAFNRETMSPEGFAAGVRASVNNCLRILDGTKKLDIFECARVDPGTPIEESIETLAEYVAAGKIGGIGLSEASAASIRRAAAVHRIEGVELEMSMHSTELLGARRDVADACAQLRIPVLAYSPLGRGFLTGQLRSLDDLHPDDPRRRQPRFQPGSFEKNVLLAERAGAMARRKGVEVSQVALAWVRAQARHAGMPAFVPIPGATTRARTLENTTEVELTQAELGELDEYVKASEPVGGRYGGSVADLCYGDSPERK